MTRANKAAEGLNLAFGFEAALLRRGWDVFDDEAEFPWFPKRFANFGTRETSLPAGPVFGNSSFGRRAKKTAFRTPVSVRGGVFSRVMRGRRNLPVVENARSPTHDKITRPTRPNNHSARHVTEFMRDAPAGIHVIASPVTSQRSGLDVHVTLTSTSRSLWMSAR